MTKAIYFDMDGTFVNFYGVDGWLDSLMAEHTKPYRIAKPLIDMREFGKAINHLQNLGYHVGIVSWLSKTSTEQYDKRVTKAKLDWLNKHLSAVEWDEIAIVPYGMTKAKVVKYSDGILFDDEKPNRIEWDGIAFDVDNIIEILKKMA